MVKNLPANTRLIRDTGSIPGLGRSPREGNGNSLQYCCLESPMDRGAWQTIVHGVIKGETQLSPWWMFTLGKRYIYICVDMCIRKLLHVLHRKFTPLEAVFNMFGTKMIWNDLTIVWKLPFEHNIYFVIFTTVRNVSLVM